MNLYENYKNKQLPSTLQSYLENAEKESKEILKFNNDCSNFMLGFLLGRKYDEYEKELKNLK